MVPSRFHFSHFLFTPNVVDGSLPPPLIRTVYDVIMHQAGGVDHFGDHGDGPLPREQIPADDRLQEVR